ncbi:hypothetical protein F4859DRAFT_466825 [Xylaria cf. heliscus]|nr:hypothetical protein F4859DRAFT_466825 [Xylaria cf. heliscus]
MASVPYFHRPGAHGSKLSAESIMVDVLPVELRLKIYELVYADLINELSDNLFGVFSLYDFIYDYTRSSLESHIGKTGLTDLLYTCKKVHDEALEILCGHAEFVLNIMGDDDGNDEERADFRFSKDSRFLEFAKSLKVNIEPLSDSTNERFLSRIHRFLEMINYGANVRSLSIRINGPNLNNPESLNQVLLALSKLQITGNRIEVYLGEVTEELLSTENLDLFLKTIHGVNMGRGHHPLEPSHYEGEEDDDD